MPGISELTKTIIVGVLALSGTAARHPEDLQAHQKQVENNQPYYMAQQIIPEKNTATPVSNKDKNENADWDQLDQLYKNWREGNVRSSQLNAVAQNWLYAMGTTKDQYNEALAQGLKEQRDKKAALLKKQKFEDERREQD